MMSSSQIAERSETKTELSFFEGQEVTCISKVLQGKADVYLSPVDHMNDSSPEALFNESFKLFSLPEGFVIGLNDLYVLGKYSYSYVFPEQAKIQSQPCNDIYYGKQYLSEDMENAACAAVSLFKLISLSYSALVKAEVFARKMNSLQDNLSMYFWILKEKYGFNYIPSHKHFNKGRENLSKIKNGMLQLTFPPDVCFFEEDHLELFGAEFLPATACATPKTDYYICLAGLPSEVSLRFFKSDALISTYHYEDASNLLMGIQSKTKKILKLQNSFLSNLYSKSGESVFTAYAAAATEMAEKGQDISEALTVLEYAVKCIKEFIAYYENTYERKTGIDISEIDAGLKSLKTAGAYNVDISMEVKCGMDYIPDELKNSLDKILVYSGVVKEEADALRAGLEAFKKMTPKQRQEDGAHNACSLMGNSFFSLYEAVAKKAVLEKNNDALINMFLKFSFLDDRLLKPEQTHSLYELANRQSGTDFPVFNAKDWMAKIYSMEKNPSVNQFGQDYFDIFREMKKRTGASDKEKAEYESDPERRFKHEIDSMFKVNHKLCYGQVSTYFPVLHEDMLVKSPEKAFVTPEAIRQSINRILSIDFSAFHREISYRSTENDIEKEFVMTQVIPEFILMPTFGSRSIMWQELTGRARSSPARFILPIFTSENLDEMLVRLTGNFRWELCKTMMGAFWNDVSQNCLTADYSDYIQFYKKNKELSEEAKSKIASLIQKHRNMTRNIFTADYETWLNCESRGIVRLNKVARSILYRHCPFARPIREQLEKQPLFTDIAVRFKNTREHEAKRIDNRYMKLKKSGIVLDEALIHNLRFYKEM